MSRGLRVAACSLLGAGLGGAAAARYTVGHGEGPDLIVNVPGGALIGAVAGVVVGAGVVEVVGLIRDGGLG